MSAHRTEPAARRFTAGDRRFGESLDRSRARRESANRRRRWRLRTRGAVAVGTIAMSALGGVALASTGAAPHHHAHQSAITLGPGSQGPPVAALQRALGMSPSGYYDSATQRAVRRFQAQHGLSVDGVAGPQTLTALGLRSFARHTVRGYTGDINAELAKIAQCESADNPQAVSPDGQFRGKYQFDMQTWRRLGGSGDPAQAPESVQDRLAAKLLRQRGTAPWPNCG